MNEDDRVGLLIDLQCKVLEKKSVIRLCKFAMERNLNPETFNEERLQRTQKELVQHERDYQEALKKYPSKNQP